jgi:hypothetical protein
MRTLVRSQFFGKHSKFCMDAHVLVYTLQTVDSFTCIALAGVSTEYLKFDLAEGGLNDINQVNAVRITFLHESASSTAQIPNQDLRITGGGERR